MNILQQQQQQNDEKKIKIISNLYEVEIPPR
jgi:hypothetical protein